MCSSDLDGLRAAIRIKEDHPRVAVLVLSQYVSPLHAQELFALPAPPGAGGAGYLLKDRVAQVADFIGALRMVVPRCMGTALLSATIPTCCVPWLLISSMRKLSWVT